MRADSSVRVPTSHCRLLRRLLRFDGTRCRVEGSRVASWRRHAPPSMGDPLVGGHEVTAAREGEDEASLTTRGRDVVQPEKSAAPSGPMAVQASAANHTRIRSHRRRLLPSCAQTAGHNAPPSGGVWATTKARRSTGAHPTARCGGPGPSWGAPVSPCFCRVCNVSCASFPRARPPRLRGKTWRRRTRRSVTPLTCGPLCGPLAPEAMPRTRPSTCEAWSGPAWTNRTRWPPPGARSCRAAEVPRPACSAACPGWHHKACSPAWTPRRAGRAWWGQGSRGGAWARRRSAVTRPVRGGGAWRRVLTNRVAACRAPALVSVPSCRPLGAGLRGSTARMAGWRRAAPHSGGADGTAPWRGAVGTHAAPGLGVEAPSPVPSRARHEGPARHVIAASAVPRWRGRTTLGPTGRSPVGEPGARMARRGVAPGTRAMPSRVGTGPAARALSKAQSAGAVRDTMAPADRRASVQDRSTASPRGSGRVAQPRRTTGKSASAERGWRAWGATMALGYPITRTAPRASQGVWSHRC